MVGERLSDILLRLNELLESNLERLKLILNRLTTLIQETFVQIDKLKI